MRTRHRSRREFARCHYLRSSARSSLSLGLPGRSAHNCMPPCRGEGMTGPRALSPASTEQNSDQLYREAAPWPQRGWNGTRAPVVALVPTSIVGHRGLPRPSSNRTTRCAESARTDYGRVTTPTESPRRQSHRSKGRSPRPSRTRGNSLLSPPRASGRTSPTWRGSLH